MSLRWKSSPITNFFSARSLYLIHCGRARAFLIGNLDPVAMLVKLGVLAEPALVGRERELEELQRCLDLVNEGKGATVFISGEAGTGKTRLVREFLKSAKEKREVTALIGWCLSNAAVPYLPFVEAFKSYFIQKENEKVDNDALDINAWLSGAKQAEKTGRFGSLSPQAWKDLTFDAVTKALLVISAYKPVILFIEDLHWADSASLSLVHYIARALIAEKILVLATFRSEELTTDHEGYAHPLAEEMRLMRQENLLKEIKLASFDGTCVTQIAEGMMGGSVNTDLVEMLSKESRGNALFVVESLRMLYERGSLYMENDKWRLSVDTLGIPDKFKDIILRRLSMLKFNQRRVLDAASVIGEKFDVELLSVVLGQDTLEVLEALNAIARSTSLVHVEENTFRFAHAKSRQAIYEEIALPLKRGYHRRVAEKLESAAKDGRLPLSEIAHHYAEAGSIEKAVEFSFEAGQDALERFSNAEAVKHFTYILQAVPEAADNSERRRAATEGLGDAYFANCRFKEAMDVFERLADAETGIVKLRAYRKAMDAGYWWESDERDPEHLQELARKAEPFAALDRLERARIRFFRGSSVGLLRKKSAEDVKEGYEDIKEALRVFEEEYSLPDAGRALGALAVTDAVFEGKVGLSALLRSAAIYEELGDFPRLIDVAFFLSVEFFACGCFKESWDTWAKVLQIGEKIGDYYRMAQASAYLSGQFESKGLVEEALPHTLKAENYSKKTDATQIEATVYAFLMRQYSKLDRMDRAEAYFSKLMNFRLETYGTSFQFSRSMAVFHAAKNEWEKAHALFKRAFEDVAVTHNQYFEILVRNDYRWALLKQGRTDEAKVEDQWIKRILIGAEEKFVHVNVDASLMAPARVIAEQEYELRLDLVNSSKNSGKLVRIDGLVPSTFKVINLPAWCSLEDGHIEMKDKSVGPFKVETVKLKLKPSKPGTFTLSPQVTYRDESGEPKTCNSNSVTITVQPPKLAYEVLPNRVPTGYPELDALLLGGIPQGYAVVLAAPSTDEREHLTKRFLEAGATAGETTFHITTEAANAKALAEKYPSNFYLFVCNPQADFIIQTLPNVCKLKGTENLTEIDIALTKAFRRIDFSDSGPKRFCVGIVSDVLLQHHALVTRKWLSALLPNFKSKGFTVLAVVDPQMHPPEELQAILSLFDGEIRIKEKETPQGIKQALRVRRLYNQKFLDTELILDREKLEQQ